jgi:hypothetical protein
VDVHFLIKSFKHFAEKLQKMQSKYLEGDEAKFIHLHIVDNGVHNFLAVKITQCISNSF